MSYTIQFHQVNNLPEWNVFVTGVMNEAEALNAYEAFAMMHEIQFDTDKLKAIDVGPTVFKIEQKEKL